VCPPRFGVDSKARARPEPRHRVMGGMSREPREFQGADLKKRHPISRARWATGVRYGIH
jgi:hypothetical protein